LYDGWNSWKLVGNPSASFFRRREVRWNMAILLGCIFLVEDELVTLGLILLTW
jgi:hypothetical protein